MPEEKKPANPIPWRQGDWGPENTPATPSYRYKVKYGDNFWKVAYADGCTKVWDFIEWNFKTRDWREVNWYLRNYVGCKTLSPDGRSYSFANADNPGIIYTRNKLCTLPPADPMPRPPGGDKPYDGPLWDSGEWVGAALKAGYMMPDCPLPIPVGPSSGVDTAVGFVASKDSWRTNNFVFSLTSHKKGYGVGGGGSLCLVLAANVYHPSDLQGYPITGSDFNLSLGLMKLKSMRGLAKVYDMVSDALSGAISSTKIVPGLLRPDRLEKLVTVVKTQLNLREFFSVPDDPMEDTNGDGLPDQYDPKVAIIDLGGPGLDLSYFRHSGNIQLFNIRYSSPKERAGY